MKLMGWSGGGLGKSQQGIIEPVTLVSATIYVKRILTSFFDIFIFAIFRLQQQLSRKGLGLHTNSLNIPQLKAKCSSIFEKFLIGDMENDIVFSDFTKHERKAIHVYVLFKLYNIWNIYAIFLYVKLRTHTNERVQ